MKRIILTLVTVFSMCCLVACGGEKTNDANAGGNNNEPVVTEAPVVEPEVTPVPAETTPEPTAEPTVEPTAEPTADPVETLTALRADVIAEQDAIEEAMQAQMDLVSPLLEVVKGLPSFEETPVYTNIPLAASQLEEYMSQEDINGLITAYNFYIFTVNNLLAEYPELTETEEFKNLLDAPTFDTIIYNLKVNTYNATLTNNETSEFEKLSHCIIDISSIEY